MSKTKQKEIKFTQSGLSSLKKDQLVAVVLELNNRIANVRTTSEQVNAMLAVEEPNLDDIQDALNGLMVALTADVKEAISTKLDEEVKEVPVASHTQQVPEPAESGPRQQYKLDRGLPILGEKDKYDNLDEWIFAVENAIKASGVPDKLILTVIPPYVRGLPAQTLMQYVKEHKDKANWIEFKQILEDNFKPVDYKDRLKIQLRDLKQGDSYDNYARKFRAIVNLLDDMSEEDKIFWFTEGLNHKTKYEVKS